MIVVNEGPSGAGKTTWCRTHGRSYALIEELPDHSIVPSEPEARARFWVKRNVVRSDGWLLSENDILLSGENPYSSTDRYDA